MSAPVWTLSVDLQTKTATFQSGMADAAKAARGSFQDIKQGASEMGSATSGSMMEARHGVQLLTEDFGIRLPRALTTFIAELGPIGAAMEAAFPFLALIALATIFVQHLSKMREEGERLTEVQSNFGTVTANVLNQLNDKLLEAGIKADELNGNHLAALEKTLRVIDHQSLAELKQSFEELSKASDAVMEQLKAHWYQVGSGSEGAKDALDNFKRQYDLLLAQGKDKEASDLLGGTLQSAQRILDLQKQARDNQLDNRRDKGAAGDAEAYKKFVEANVALSAAGTDHSEKAISAQENLVAALQSQITAQQKISDLKKADQGNARTETQKTVDSDSDTLVKQQADDYKRATEEQDKLDDQRYQQAVANIQQGEREKIAATDQGSAERLAAIDAAIKEENTRGLQETGFYKELLTQRVDTAKQFAAEQRKLQPDAGKEAADHAKQMGLLQVAADREAAEVRLSTKHKGDQERVQSDIDLENEAFTVRTTAAAQQLAALDRSDKEYENKLKALQDRQEELVREHEEKITAIKDQAEMARTSRLLSAEQHFNDSVAKNLTDALMRHQSFGRMINSLGDEIATGMIQNAIKSILADDMTKEHDAAAAARKAFLAGMQLPFPANLVAAPVLGAAAFASVMAFEGGGLVPGVGIGDIQPAMLTPGEAVLPKNMTEKLSRASDDSGDSGHHIHVHHTNHYTVHAIDGASVEGMLNKHASTFHKHVENQLRRMNK